MKKYILFFLLLVIIFGGLKNIRELNELAIVRSIGIDLTEDKEICISAIVANTSKETKEDTGIVYTAVGKSVQEAARNMVDISPKKLYMGHLEALVICEDIAREELENTLDFFIRDNEGSNSFYLFIAKESSAEDILNTINQEEVDVISFLKSTQKYKGNANLNTLNDNLKSLLETGTDLCVNSVSIEDDKLTISDMVYFEGWKMKGYLTTDESILYNILKNNTDNFIITLGEKDDLIVAEAVSSKTKISVDKKEENTINIELKLDTNITQVGKNINLNEIYAITDTKKQISDKLKNEIELLYDKLKEEYKVDIIGIGNELYRNKNELYNEENYLEKVKINVKVETSILGQGGVKKVW